MEDVRLIVDIVIALGAATIGGFIARRLGLPALIGYILAGLAIGPNTPGLVADQDRVQLLANLGVALLMFGLGVEFSLSEVVRVRRVGADGHGVGALARARHRVRRTHRAGAASVSLGIRPSDQYQLVACEWPHAAHGVP